MKSLLWHFKATWIAILAFIVMVTVGEFVMDIPSTQPLAHHYRTGPTPVWDLESPMKWEEPKDPWAEFY